MATVEMAFTNNNAVTITLASLANGSTALSNAIDNSSNKFISADIQVKTKTNAAGTSATGTVTLYLIRSVDGGSNYDDANDNAEILGVFNANANATTYLFSVDSNVAGSLPSSFKLAIKNNSGAALDASGASHAVAYAGKKFSVV